MLSKYFGERALQIKNMDDFHQLMRYIVDVETEELQKNKEIQLELSQISFNIKKREEQKQQELESLVEWENKQEQRRERRIQELESLYDCEFKDVEEKVVQRKRSDLDLVVKRKRIDMEGYSDQLAGDMDGYSDKLAKLHEKKRAHLEAFWKMQDSLRKEEHDEVMERKQKILQVVSEIQERDERALLQHLTVLNSPAVRKVLHT